MGKRMYSDEMKLEIVLEYLKGQKSAYQLARKYGITKGDIQKWRDTLKGEDDFSPFRNIMNEWYARDTSKKIKSVSRQSGCPASMWLLLVLTAI